MNIFIGASLNYLNLLPLKLTGDVGFSLIIFADEVIVCEG